MLLELVFYSLSLDTDQTPYGGVPFVSVFGNLRKATPHKLINY